MTLGRNPNASRAGRDEDNNTLLAGVETGTDNVSTLETVAGSGPGRGVLAVHVASGSLDGGSVAGIGQVLVTDTAAALPALPAKSVLLVNHDGAEVNGNTETVWIGDSALVAVGDGFPLLPGAGISLPVGDLGEIFVISANGGQVLSYIAEE